MKLSVIVPALDEEASIERALASAAEADERIVVDGGSADATVAIARASGAIVVEGPRGRGLQQQLGADKASGDVLLFLHADSALPPGFRASVLAALATPTACWGRFDLRFDGAGPLLRLIAWLISTRTRLTRVATGDQAIFVTRGAFERVGGFRERLLFEDLDLTRRLKREGAMVVPPLPVVTSSRRWRSGGIWRTTFLMWGLKAMYLSGVPAERLAGYYRRAR